MSRKVLKGLERGERVVRSFEGFSFHLEGCKRVSTVFEALEGFKTV